MKYLRYPFLSLVLCGTVAAQAATSIAEGEHFRVVCHFDNEAVAEQALAAVEAAWAPALEVLGARSPSAKHSLLAVHLYRNAADYVAAEAELTGGQFQSNLAFAHFDSKTAHVAVQPNLSDGFLVDRGLNYQTLRLLVHEAMHLVRYHTTLNYRSHPQWFADGSASWLAATVLQNNGGMTEPAADPHFSGMMVRGQRLLSGKKLPSLRGVMGDEAMKLEPVDRYAVHWLLFDFLYTSERKAMEWWAENMRRLGGSRTLGTRLAENLERRLGRREFDRLAAGFEQHVQDLEPQWQEVYRSLEAGEDDWIVTAFDTTNAIAWRTEAVGEGPWAVTGAVTVLPGERTQLNLLLGRRPEGFVTIALAAGNGVTVFGFSAPDDRWDRLAFVRSSGLTVGKRVPFRVGVADGQLRVALDGEQLLETPVEIPLDGAWGVGAQAGSSGVWHDVKLVRGNRR